jgi:hypothetical protein
MLRSARSVNPDRPGQHPGPADRLCFQRLGNVGVLRADHPDDHPDDPKSLIITLRPHDIRGSGHRAHRGQRQATVRPLPVVVADVDAQEPQQMPAAQFFGGMSPTYDAGNGELLAGWPTPAPSQRA